VSFWEAIEEHIAALDRDAEQTDEGTATVSGSAVPNPWADIEVGDAALTARQVAFLAGLSNQPPPPRRHGPDAWGPDPSAGGSTVEDPAPGGEPGDRPVT